MTDNLRLKIDPRLQFSLQIVERPESLQAAHERGDVFSMDGAAPTAATAGQAVLLELNGASDDASLDGLALRNIAGNIFTAKVPVSRIPELANSPVVKSVEAARKWYPMLDTSLSETRADVVRTGSASSPARTGRDVVVGIIDFGLDFTLDDFRNADGSTRVAFFWDQFLTAQGTENAPAGFGYGVEYTATDMDAALFGGGDPFTSIRHDPGIASHGTHVAGTAAGNGRSSDGDFPAGRFVGAAPDATIIFVQPDSNTDRSFTDSRNVADAISYIFEKADELGMPCVINMSLGQNGGSHDGESVVERAIDRLLEPSGRAFVSAAGNEQVWRGHASGNIDTGDTRELRWKVGGGMPLPGGGSTGIGPDRTPSEMEIWYSSRDRFRVTVIDPDGNASATVEPDGSEFVSPNPTTDVFISHDRFTILNGDARVFIQLAPNQPNVSVMRGEWRVVIEALESSDQRFDAWIERDARNPNNAFADQSFFVGADFDPVMTLGTPATTRRGIAVANYDHRVEAVNSSSSRGPTRVNILKPEVAAPGTNIMASASLGGRPDGQGGTVPMRISKTGTSMAAPHVAGIIALLFEQDPGQSNATIAKILKATADNPDGGTDYDVAWGFGRVNAARAISLLRNPNQPSDALTH